MVDQTDLDAVAAAVRPETTLVWVETPTNPTLKVIDVPAVVIARSRRRVRRGRQHVRDAGLPAAAGARRGRRRALDDQVPRRALGRRRRRGRRARRGRARRRCGSCRTRSAPCPGRWTASSCTAGCARCTCGWRRTPRTRAWSSAWLEGVEGVYDVRWPGLSGMVSFRHPDAVADRVAHAACSRWRSRSAASSR